MLRWVLAFQMEREGCGHGEHGEHGEINSPLTWLVCEYPNLPPMAEIPATQFTYPNHSNQNVIFLTYQETFPFSNSICHNSMSHWYLPSLS